MSIPTPNSLMVAAVGDVHGQHHAMVDLVERAADAAGVRPDVVLQVGDFEPHRHEADVATMAAARHQVPSDSFYSWRTPCRAFVTDYPRGPALLLQCPETGIERPAAMSPPKTLRPTPTTQFT